MKVKANRVIILGGYRCFKNRVVTIPDSVLDTPYALKFYNNVVSLGYLEVIEPPVLASESESDGEGSKSKAKKAS